MPEKTNRGSESDRPGKLPQIAGEIDALAQAVTDIGNLSERLDERLSPVLRREDKIKENDLVGTQPILVDVAEAIRTQRHRLERVSASLVDLLGRIEI